MSDTTQIFDWEDDERPELGYEFRSTFAITVVFLAILVSVVCSIGVSNQLLAGDAVRVTENFALRSWSGLKHIWTRPHHYPDFSPLAYTTYLLESKIWGFQGERVAVWYRVTNLCFHVGSVLAIYVLLDRLRVAGAWLSAALFGIHPVATATICWISQLPTLLGSLFGALTLLSLARPLQLVPTTVDRFKFIRLPDSRIGRRLSCAILLALTIASSPAIAAAVGPLALILCWWKKGRLGWEQVRPVLPLLVVTLGILVVAVMLALRLAGNDLLAPGSSLATRPMVALQQLGFYLTRVVAPYPISFSYQPFSSGLGLVAVSAASTACLLLLRNRGLIAAAAIFLILIAPSLIFIQSDELFGGWVGIQRLYPAHLTIIVLLVASAASLPISRRTTIGLTATALVVVSVLGSIEAVKRRSQYSLWKDVLSRQPDSLDALQGLGDAALNRGIEDAEKQSASFAEATSFFDSAARAHPEKILPILKLGSLDERSGNFERAMNSYRRALQLEPRNFEANFGMARVLARGSDSTAALRQFQATLQLRPNEPNVLASMGLLHSERGEFELAEAEYRKALAIDPRCIAARVNLANLLGFHKKDPEAAAKELLAVLEVDPHNFEAFMNGGTMLAQLQQFEKAAVLFRRAIEVRDSSADAYSNRAMALIGMTNSGDVKMTPDFKRGLLGEAEFLFEQAALRAPNNAEHKKNAAIVSQMRDALAPPKQ